MTRCRIVYFAQLPHKQAKLTTTFHFLKPLLKTSKDHIESCAPTVLTINSIVYGLQYLFLEPNPDDPLNVEAADELRDELYKNRSSGKTDPQ